MKKKTHINNDNNNNNQSYINRMQYISVKRV